MRLLVESEISATRYKRLVDKLKGLSKRDLWKVMDHYIFHVMEDTHVDTLLTLLAQGVLQDYNGVQDQEATYPEPEVTYPPDFKIAAEVTVDPSDLKFEELTEKTEQSIRRYGQDARSIIVNTLPTQDDLTKFKTQLDLLYDYNFFSTCLVPELRQELAGLLIAFANTNKIPVQNHWIEFSETI